MGPSDRGTIVAIGVAKQSRRRQRVRRQLAAAGDAIDAGLAGEIPLEEAVCEADRHLIPAVREVMRAEL